MTPRFNKGEMPVSVILPAEQTEWLKQDAARHERRYSQHLRWIVSSYISHMQTKERSDGEKGKEARQKGGQEGQKGA